MTADVMRRWPPRHAMVVAVVLVTLLPAAVLASTAGGVGEGWIEIRPSRPLTSIGADVVTPSIPQARTGVVAPPSSPEARSANREREVDLFVGDVKVLPAPTVRRVAVGNGALLKIEHLEEGELVLIGEAPGDSTLQLWHDDGSRSRYVVRIAEHDPHRRLPAEPMIRMQVRMIEFRRRTLRELGLDWTTDVGGHVDAVVPGEGRQAVGAAVSAGLDGRIVSRLDLLLASGAATVLAEPVLSCASGASANFLAGGELPYPTVDEGGRTRIEFKEYGIRLDVSPVIDGEGRIRARVDTEISRVDTGTGTGGTPGLLTRRARTDVSVRSGETVVISGLLSHERSGESRGLPVLSRLPWLGRLFRSEATRSETSELAIFLTPELAQAEMIADMGRSGRVRESSAVRAFDALLRELDP